jgi:hypothetical protein
MPAYKREATDDSSSNHEERSDEPMLSTSITGLLGRLVIVTMRGA